MSLTTLSLKGLTAKLLISQPAATLAESTAIVRRLQSFGPITSFTKLEPKTAQESGSPHDGERQEIHVVFSDPETVQIAFKASPFVVKVHHNLPDPRVEDPFNLRGLQSRVHPKPSTMTCVVQAHDQSIHTGQNILSSGFSPSNKTRLYQSLLEASPPSNIAEGLGVFESDKSHILDTTHLVEGPPDLTSMYSEPARGRVKDVEKPSHKLPVKGVGRKNI
ncbi:hypothetical protein LTR10_023284 [Elasticomyces elasticus]|uniref:RRM domain-containing protein n=1 Tax=Exophiala sideris TaxID=1016849 RepID=A0ABR0IZ85_9EURO|nr:hypothetical protein LTR10_023284 [Elasticomyces elasticus]KAK5023088.1 hypothetical protein LTS07_009581 [Exophiala sideris]KAK5026813.1 hypothetical protein LTR13_009853 [Exophiala sideris]KAK5052466.1 hypothetical protein LTR69_009804 [Exophiala sideris]KAK5178251.1 hypothetical protein LTR44_009335 [Eurotiomycetes sp. CCFEE 6388]